MNKKFLAAVVLVVMAISTFVVADLSNDQKYELNTRMGQVAFKHQLGTAIARTEKIKSGDSTFGGADGTLLKRVARVTWDMTKVAAGSSLKTNGSAFVPNADGSHFLGDSVPAGAIITRSYFQIVKKPATENGTSPAATLAFGCNPASSTLFVGDFEPAGASTPGFYEGKQSGAVVGYTYINQKPCTLSANVSHANFTTDTPGKVVLFVEYVIGQ